MEALIQIGVVAVLVCLGFFIGRIAEKRHYASIHAREREYLPKPTMTWDDVENIDNISQAQLAVGSVVISLDYYKRILAGFRMFFGGELRSYAPLLDRGRREAILRMKESCPHADAYVNCRVESSAIAKTLGKKNTVGGVEVLVYATALYYRK
jgi:uncharacterized protein YbjQ (UPF0145 family)